MPDISMCDNTTCELRNKCYRFTATPSPTWQTYAYFTNTKENPCQYYWETKNK